MTAAYCVRRVAADAHDHGAPQRRPLRQRFDPGVDARVLEADGVDHPGRGLGDAGRRVAGPRVGRDCLGDIRGVRKVGEVVAVVATRVLEQVERAGGVHQRMLEPQRAQLDGELDLLELERRRHRATSSRANTGPSLHTRSLPRLVSTTQP